MIALIQIIRGLGDWFGWVWKESWRLFKEWNIALWGLVLGVFSFLLPLLDFPIRLINWLLLRIQQIDIPSFDFSNPSGAHQILAIANTFFPLDEFVRWVVAYCIFYLIVTAYRIIRSWIPRIHGYGLNNG